VVEKITVLIALRSVILYGTRVSKYNSRIFSYALWVNTKIVFSFRVLKNNHCPIPHRPQRYIVNISINIITIGGFTFLTNTGAKIMDTAIQQRTHNY
jgi:hypothetical protein